MAYVIGCIAFIALLRGLDNGRILVWYAIIAAWGTDTCAYLAGIKFGKTKFSKVSPKKSVEGCVAGVFGAIFAALVYTFAINYFMGLSISYLTGHGGMLDRIDSVMFIAPYAYLLLMLFV